MCSKSCNETMNTVTITIAFVDAVESLSSVVAQGFLAMSSSPPPSCIGSQDNPFTDAHLPPTPPKKNPPGPNARAPRLQASRNTPLNAPFSIPTAAEAPNKTRWSIRIDLGRSVRFFVSHRVFSGRSFLAVRVLSSMIRIDSTPLVLALVASKGVNALVNARNAILDDETPDSELERHAYLHQVVVDASLDMLSHLDPTAPYATIMQRSDLYVDPSLAPPTLDVVSTDSHLCYLCKQVKSHPVLHSFCFVCLRVLVNTSWLCPHPGCAEVQHRPPIPLPSLQADIENTYVGFLDFTQSASQKKTGCDELASKKGEQCHLCFLNPPPRLRTGPQNTTDSKGQKKGKKAEKLKKDKKQSKGTAAQGIITEAELLLHPVDPQQTIDEDDKRPMTTPPKKPRVTLERGPHPHANDVQ
ncbi:hypothetical protein C8F01DRAFT_1084355 [Mycena amicta]|nr:hypothetical protein C8F01DRAFT_1084355 [Mycena amicta]